MTDGTTQSPEGQPVIQSGDSKLSLARKPRSRRALMGKHHEEIREKDIQIDYEKQRAETDPVTEIMNGIGFDRKLREELDRSQRDGRKFVFLLVDLNGLGEINKKGHMAGDAALWTTGQALDETFRELDFARLHGDEFAVVMPETELESVHVPFARLTEKLGNEVSISAGAIIFDPSLFPRASSNAVQREEEYKKIFKWLIDEADKPLERAKEMSKDPRNPKIRHSELVTSLDLAKS